jgi:plastocyanin
MELNMLKSKTTCIKTSLLMALFGLMTSNAFCGGTITGTIQTDLQKYKKGAVVYLSGVKGPVRPQQKSIDQENLTFVPKVTTIPVGSTILFTNHDKIYHNIHSSSEAKQFNVDTYDAQSRSVTFDKPGPVHLLCNVHSEMTGWVVVTDNQYAAVSEHDGRFTIPDVPAGTYEIAVWSEKLKHNAHTTVTVADGKTSSVDINLDL